MFYKLAADNLRLDDLEALGGNVVFLDGSTKEMREMSDEETDALAAEAKTLSPYSSILELSNYRYILLLPYYSADQSTGIQQFSSGSGGESNTFVANNVVVICMPTE